MRIALLVIAAGALMGTLAQAKDNPNAMAAGKDAVDLQRSEPALKKLYVCDADEASWNLVSRDLRTPVFVTAQQVRADKSAAWSAPKCITEAELRRLTVAKTTPAR